MNKNEVFEMLRRNKWGETKAVTFIADFLCISKKRAKAIYYTEFLAS